MILSEAWKKVALRLQSVAKKDDTLSVINFTVVTNGSGIPLFWADPKVVRLEPKKHLSLEFLKQELSDEQLNTLLQYIGNNA